MVLGALADFLYKRAQVFGVSAASFLVVQAVFFNLTAWTLTLLGGELDLGAPVFRYAPAAGVVFFSSVFLFLRSLRGSDATVNVPIFRLSFIPSAILAVMLLGEHLSGLRLLAIGLAVAGILSLADLGRLRQGRVKASSLAALLLAMVLFGVSATIYKVAMGAGAGPGTFLVVQGSTFLVLGLALSLFTDRLRMNRATWLHAPFCGVLLSSALFLLLASLRVGDATVSVPISQLSFVLTSVLAVAFLRERLSRRRLIGTAAAVLAVVTFNLPGQ
jgi:drug/metabolite transporter (DMT)-like permease